MPFICILHKNSATSDAVNTFSVQYDQLVKKLCPYKGQIRCTLLPHGKLYTSDLCDLFYDESKNTDNDDKARLARCLIPKNSHKTSQSSWLEIMQEDETLSFQTDPLGTFPLWYIQEDDYLIITSEVKSFTALNNFMPVELKGDASMLSLHRAQYSPYKNIQRVTPGVTLRVDRSLKVFEQGESPLIFFPATMYSSPLECKTALGDALGASAKEMYGVTNNWGCFLSGGVDSSVCASLLKGVGVDALDAYTLESTLGSESQAASETAHYLSVGHQSVLAQSDEIAAHFNHVVFCNEILDGLTAETLVQLSILSKAAAHQKKHVATGYGADLLFGSMLQHKAYMAVAGVTDLKSLIDRTFWSREFSPFFAWAHGVELYHLFWHPLVMNTAFKIPFSENFLLSGNEGGDGAQDKMILRRLAVEKNLLEHGTAFRKKNTITDGTRFNQIFSTMLGLSGQHAYAEKSDFCHAMLRDVFH